MVFQRGLPDPLVLARVPVGGDDPGGHQAGDVQREAERDDVRPLAGTVRLWSPEAPYDCVNRTWWPAGVASKAASPAPSSAAMVPITGVGGRCQVYSSGSCSLTWTQTPS